MIYYVEFAGQEHVVEVRQGDAGVEVKVDGTVHPVDIAEVHGAGLFSLLVDGDSHQYGVRMENGDTFLAFHDREVELQIEDERTRLAREATGGSRAGAGPAEVKSVMPGVVKEVRVAVGDTVEEGQPLLILEAMKMENEIRATHAGVVETLHAQPGAAVEKGAPLVTLKAPDES